jgi:hypothetical protein
MEKSNIQNRSFQISAELGASLLMNIVCQIEHVASDSDVGTPCGNRAVAECADCGVLICFTCRFECCGDPFCDQCYGYHVTHTRLKKPVQNEWKMLPTFRATPNKAG